MRNRIILIILMVLSCGKAYALPQDWPCTAFELKKCEQAANKDLTDYTIYCGQDDNYSLKVNVFWREDKDMESDDCGTAGCDGTITNLKTGQEENLRFFCETENNYHNAKCYIRTGEEYILQKVTDEYYKVNLCNNVHYKYVSLKECSGCTCVLHDSRKQDGTPDFYVGCKQDGNQLHCMTGNIYEEKYYPASGIDDFKNCVGLTSF